MSQDLALLLGLTQQALALGLVVFLRVGAAMALLPAFGETAVPQRLRLMLALAFTLVIAPAVAPLLPDAAARQPLVWVTEPLAGLAFGLALRLSVMALTMAGTMAAQATSLAQMFAGLGPEPQPVIGQMLLLAGLAVAVTLGLHLRIAEALIDSYRVFPPGLAPDPGALAGWATASVAASFALAFGLAMPFTIGALVYNVALGLINRAMPQLMVALVGAPALTLGGILLMLLAAPTMIAVWASAFAAVLARPF